MTDDGKIKGKIRLYCTALEVSRQAFYDYLANKDKPWKYQALADAMIQIHNEDEGNAGYGRVHMYQALQFKKELGEIEIDIPCEGTVRSVMEQIGLRTCSHRYIRTSFWQICLNNYVKFPCNTPVFLQKFSLF